jgi:hypothetical protein
MCPGRAGADAPDHACDAYKPVIIDLDATLVTAHPDKELAAPNFKRGFGFHPLCAFVDHETEGTGEPLSMMLRPGNAGSNTAVDHIAVIRQALRQLPFTATGGRIGRKVLIRTDSAGATHEVIDWLTARHLSYSLGFTLTDDTVAAIAKIPDHVWTPASDTDGDIRDGAWVLDATGVLDLSGCAEGMRVIVRAERPNPARNYGSPTCTATGSPRSLPTPPAVNLPTWNCDTGAGPAAKTGEASASAKTPACATSRCTALRKTTSGSRSSPSRSS